MRYRPYAEAAYGHDASDAANERIPFADPGMDVDYQRRDDPMHRLVKNARQFTLLVLVLLAPTGALAAEDISGQWSGSFQCGQDEMSFSLELEAGGALLEGLVTFESAGTTGSHAVTGRYNPDSRAFTIIPGTWLERPAGWRAAGLSGTLHENGLSVAGSANACKQDTGTFAFQAKRLTGAVSTKLAEPLPVPQFGGPFEGRWTGQCVGQRREYPLIFDILQEDDIVVATASLDDGRNPRMRGAIVDGEVLLRSLRFQQRYPLPGLRLHLQPDGSLVGQKEQGGLNCREVVLLRTGEPVVPSSNKVEMLEGLWAGYFFSEGHEDLRRLVASHKKVQYLDRRGVSSALLTLAEVDGVPYGLYRLASPVLAPAQQQYNYWVTLRPLYIADDGRVAYVTSKVHRAEGDGYSRTAPITLLLSPFDQGGLLAERLRADTPKHAYFQLLPIPEGHRLFAHPEEGPPMRLPETIGGSLGSAQTLDEQCRALDEWMSALEHGRRMGQSTVDANERAALPIITDSRFQPLAGLPFVLLDDAERDAIRRVVGVVCPPRAGWERYPAAAIHQVFGTRAFHKLAGLLVDYHESAGWLEDALNEVAGLSETPETLPVLARLETEARTRRAEITIAEMDAFEAVIAEKRNAIGVTDIAARLNDLSGWPDDRSTLARLEKLVDDARQWTLPDHLQADLRQLSLEKARTIVVPVLTEAVAQASTYPPTLNGLGDATRLMRETLGFVRRAEAIVGPLDAQEYLRQLRDLREVFVAAPQVQAGFASALEALAPQGNPKRTVEAFAAQYLEETEFKGASASAVYIELMRSATLTLELRAISFSDRSHSTVPGEPSGEDMFWAVKRRFDAINEELTNLHTRCRTGQFQNDPVAALECIPVLAAGGIEMRLTRFEKLGCAPGIVRAGYVCDYVLGFVSTNASDMPLVSGRMQEITGDGSVAQGRFMLVDDEWFFTTMNR